MRADAITKEKEQKVLSLYGKLKAKEIAREVSVTINQVYEVAKRHKITNKLNQKVTITYLQDQILLSGIMGDGRLKRNGRYNYYYSECHAMGEKDYLQWKFDNLGDLTKNSNIYGKNLNNEHNDALEFTTKTTPSLISYAELSYEEIIPKLNKEGLLLLLLDDGWFNNNSKKGRFCLTAYQYERSVREMLKDRYIDVLKVDVHIVGIKRENIAFSSPDNPIFYKIATELMSDKLDIIQKKFGHIIKTNQV